MMMRRVCLSAISVFACIIAVTPAFAQDIACEQFVLTDQTADPMTPLPILTPVPDAVQVVGVDFGGGLTATLPVLVDEAPLTPIFLPAPLVGGSIRLSFEVGQVVCDLGEIAIAALPTAPGTLREMMASTQANARFFESVFGLTRSASGDLEGQVSALPPPVQSLLLWQEDLEKVFNLLADDPLANAVTAQMGRVGILPAPPPTLRRADLHLIRPVRLAQTGRLGLLGATYEPQCPANADELANEVDDAFQA